MGMCVVLVPNIGISTSVSNTTQIRHRSSETSFVSTRNVGGARATHWSWNHHIQYYTNTPTALKKLMCFYWECAWCQCQILVLAPAYLTLHNYAHSSSETSYVCTGYVHGAIAKFWSQNHHIQHYTNMPIVLQKPHACLLGMSVALVPNIGISTSVSNTTQIRQQPFRNFMCVHWECAWCWCQILVLAPAYPTLHKYAHSSSEILCVSTMNLHGAGAKYWYQHQHIQHYTNAPTAVQKLHVCPLGMCVVLVRNIGLNTSIFNTTQIRPQNFRNFIRVHWECAWCQ